MILEVLAGCLVGLSLGLTGGGGSLFAVPLLVYLIGLSPARAIPISLITVGASAAFGSLYHIKHHHVDWQSVLFMGAMGFLLAPLGAHFTHAVSSLTLMMIFGGLMCFVGALMLYKLRERPPTQDDRPMLGGETTTQDQTPPTWPLLLLFGSITGALTGFLGVGGGFLIVPILTLVSAMPLVRAIGSSLVIIAIVSLSGVGSHLVKIDLPWAETLLFLGGSLFGIMVGTRTAKQLSDRLLKKAFAGVIVLFGATVVVVNGLIALR